MAQPLALNCLSLSLLGRSHQTIMGTQIVAPGPSPHRCVHLSHWALPSDFRFVCSRGPGAPSLPIFLLASLFFIAYCVIQQLKICSHLRIFSFPHMLHPFPSINHFCCTFPKQTLRPLPATPPGMPRFSKIPSPPPSAVAQNRFPAQQPEKHLNTIVRLWPSAPWIMG